MASKGKFAKKIYLSKEAMDFLNNYIDNASEFIDSLILQNRGLKHEKERLKTIIFENPNTLKAKNAENELFKLEEIRLNSDYKLHELESKEIILRAYKRNISNHGYIPIQVKEMIQDKMSMDSEEISIFIDQVISEYEQGLFERVDLLIRIEELKKEVTHDKIVSDERKPIKHKAVEPESYKFW
jgi:hypothetical protein